MDLDLSNYHLDFVNGRIYRFVKKYQTYEISGTKKEDGYIIINIQKKLYRAHRILYERFHNRKLEKDEFIDHINRVRNDNRIENLRVVSNKLNSQNRGKQCNNKSGYKNITRNKKYNKWEFRIKEDDKYKNYGYFLNIEDAIAKRDIVIKNLNEKHNYIFSV